MADRCLQRPDCTSVTMRREKDIVCVLVPPPRPPKIQVPSIVTVRDMWRMLWKKHCAPLSASLAATLSRWPGSISPGAQVQRVLYRPPIYHQGYLPTSVWPGSLTAPLSQPQDSSALRVREMAALELPASRRRSCQSCYFRALGQERENVFDVCRGERFRVSCPHHSTLENSSPVTVSNINISSQRYKHKKISCWCVCENQCS